ncbi:hypothetical protein ACFLZK_02210 [Patescibacteria group bacterium]
MPDSNPLYELVGGYYPGDPIPRKRPPYVDRPQPMEFNSNALVDDYINAIKRDLKKLSFNERLKEQWVEDIELSLFALSKAKRDTYDSARALELGDEEQVAGVQLKVSLNPKDWIEDPGGMVKKTAQSWTNAFLNYSDMDAYVEKKHLWKPLLEGNVGTVHPIAQSVFGRHVEEGVEETNFQPFQLIGLNITTPIETKLYDKSGDLVLKDGIEQVDLFDRTAQNFISYNDRVRSSGSRNDAYKSLVDSSLHAATSEIENNIKLGNLGAQEIVELEHFRRSSKVFRDMNSINNDLENVSKDLAKHYLNKELKYLKAGQTVDEYFQENIKEKISDKAASLQLYIEESEKLLGGDEAAIRKFTDGLVGVIKYDGAAADLKREAENLFGTTRAKDFTKDVSLAKRYLEELKNLEKEIVSGKLSTMNLKGTVDLLNGRLARNDIAGGSLDRMGKNIVQEHLLSGDGYARKVIFENKHIIGSKNLINVNDEAAAMLFRQNFNDFIDKLEEDGLIGIIADQAWNLVRKRLDGFTPATVTKEFMKKTHYFGLIYDPDYDYIHGGSTGAINRYFTNRIKRRKIYDNNQQIILNGKKFKFVGEKGLRHGVKALKQTALDRANPNFFTDEDFLDFLNGAMLKDAGLKNWLLLHKDELGIQMENGIITKNAENMKLLKGLFTKLREKERTSYISIFQDRAGLLQKLSQWATGMQQKFFDGVGKYVAPLAYARNVLSKKGAKALVEVLKKSKFMQKLVNSKAAKVFAKLLSKLFGAAIGGATGGVGTVIWAVIERLIQYVIKKVTDFVKKIAESIKKGDASIINAFVEEGASTIFKTVITCSGCFALMAFIIMLPITVMLAAITPVDPTRMTNWTNDSAGSGGGDGASSVCTIPGVCDVTGVVGCFEFLEQQGSEWPAGTQEIIEEAAENLLGAGHYVNRLCADGTIEVAWNPSVACGRARMSSGNRIEFGNSGCYSYTSSNQDKFNWLFAHETGHIFHARVYSGADVLASARAADCGNTQATYVGTTGLECRFDMHTIPGGQEEDFAELVGNFVTFINKCSITNGTGGDMARFFHEPGPWNESCPNAFNGHYDFAMKNMFGAP